jgi:asparagine synthase (glutamine-hydrolysing)
MRLDLPGVELMCGISGVVSLSGRQIDLASVQRMNDLLSHRGPDGEGFLLGSFEAELVKTRFTPRTTLDDGQEAHFALGHRRLAIIDLSARGTQPMTVEDGQTWIIFNGEIYNYQKIRCELEAQGYSFKTRTDTEVLLQAYRHWGEDCLKKLEGMYAFAIWDSARRSLFAARDRFGIKPFYYAVKDACFIFASEIKAIVAFTPALAEPDDDALLGFLAHGNCDYGERTTFRNIKALPPGCCITLDMATKQLTKRQYYEVSPYVRHGPSDEERIQELRELLIDTIRKHLISDVQAGSCLSGGLDSSTVVSLIGKLCRDEPASATAVGPNLRTFTSCYAQREIDERDYALAVARSVKATPQLVFPSPDEFWTEFQRMAWHQDMPFGGLSYYAQWRVMRAAHEAGVKVLLDGQGGDEVFGGYAKFRYGYIASLGLTGRLPTLAREVIAMLKQGDNYVLDLRKGYRYLPPRLRGLLQVDSLLEKVVKSDWKRILSGDSNPATRRWFGNSRSELTIMQRMQLDDISTDTLPQLLRLEDRSSMAFSIEARVPLLDHRLVEYGISLPDSLKVRRGWSKYAVREALSGLMPEAVRTRTSKLGFAAPDRAWLSTDLRSHIDELLASDLRCRKYVDVDALRRWYSSSKAMRANTESYLGMFRILSLEMWMRAFKVS